MTSASEIEGDDIFSALSAVCPSVCLEDFLKRDIRDDLAEILWMDHPG